MMLQPPASGHAEPTCSSPSAACGTNTASTALTTAGDIFNFGRTCKPELDQEMVVPR